MTSKVLSGVIALVSFRADGTFNFKQTISTKLTNMGARVTSRFSKDVTHVVFQKRLKPTHEQQLAEASDLRALYDKAAKAENPVHVVSLLWVERSAADQARAMEQKYTLPRPTDADLLQPGAGITPGSSGRKRSRRTIQPKDSKELELDVQDAMYSSSQQINGQQKPGWDVGEVSSPAPQKPKQCQKGQQAVTKYIRHDSSNSRAGKAHEHKAAAPAVQSEASAEDSLLKAKPVKAGQSIATALLRQTRRKTSANDVLQLKAEEAASVLALDLRQAAHTGKRKRQDVQLQPDDCCTPELGKAQAAAQAATTVKAGARSPGSKKLHPKTTGKQVSNKAAIQAMPGDGSSQRSVTGMKQGQGRRSSRLASATPAADSQPESHTLEPHSDAPDAAAQETMRQSSSAVVPDSDDEDMPDAGPSDGHSEGTVQAIGSAELGENNEQRTQAKCKAPGVVPVLLPGGSSRFSARHLKQKMEAKLPVSKATPIGLPPTPMLPATQQAGPIPIPMFSRVPSPWTSTPGNLSQPSPAVVGQLPPVGVAASAEMPPPLAVTSQVAAARGQHQQAPASTQGDLESAAPWSACRLWDPKHAMVPTPGLQPANTITQEHQQQQQLDRATRFQQGQQGDKASSDAAQADGGDQPCEPDQDTEMSEADEEGDGDDGQASTVSGCLGLSCVEAEVQEVARSAVRSLRGVRLCAEGHEEGRLTHLVLGRQRRTLKVLLAIAAGAVLVTPEWLTSSLEAGEWLPEAPFLAQGRFAEAATAAREAQGSDRPQPLHGKRVYVHVAEAAKKGPSTGNGGPLRRLVAALGGKIVGAKACNLCIVSGGCSRPANLSSNITAVREEWLLKGAEQYQLESERVHAAT